MRLWILLVLLLFTTGCHQDKKQEQTISDYGIITKTITYNNINVDVIIDKPSLKEVDVLVIFHGSVKDDENIIPAAKRTLEKFKSILNKQDMMLVSVAYPQHSVLLGDNIHHAEAALLWVQNCADEELNVKIKKVFLAGHSLGGYLVTRLNTMQETNGVIANAPGPLNLVFRCRLEEKGKIRKGYVCDTLRRVYGATTTNANAYFQRSLLNYTNGFKSDILFVQGLDDRPIQMHSWATFKQAVLDCKNCKNREFVEVEDAKHGALFESPIARKKFNHFINSRR